MPGLMQFARRHRVAVCAVVAVVTFATFPVVKRLRVDPDVLNLLPQSGPAVRAFRTYLSVFGSFDRVYVVFEAPEDGLIDDYAPFVDRYAELLRRDPEILRVDTQLFDPGKDWSYVFDHVFMLLGPEATAGALNRLTTDGIGDELSRARERLRLPSPAIKELVRQDPFNYLGLLRERLSAANAFVRIDPAAEGYVSKDGHARLVIATPVHPPFDLAFSRRVKAVLDRTAAAVRAEAARSADLGDAAAVRVSYAGGYHLALETERLMRREAFFNLVGSLAGILVLLLLVFRSAWLFLAGALPMIVGGLLAAAVIGFSHPNLSGAAAGASALLFGLGIDGLVLLYARYLEERPTSDSAGEAVGRLGGSASSMLLGMFTSAATFLALTLVEFPSLRELGRIIGLGMIFGGIATFVLVPALLPAAVKPRRPLRLPWLPAFVERRRRDDPVGRCHCHRRPWRRDPVAAPRPLAGSAPAPHRAARHRARDRQPVRAAGRPRRDPVRGARPRSAAEDEPAAGGRGREVRRRPVAVLGRDRRCRPPRHRPAWPTSCRGPACLRPMSAAAWRMRRRLLGFRPDAFAPFLERTPRLLDPSSRITFEGYQQHGLGDLLSPYIARTPAGFAMAAYVHPRSPADLEVMRSIVDRVGAPLRLTGMPVVNRELSEGLVPQFLIGVAIGGVAVFVLMWFTFRNLRLTALALLPTILGIVWGAGILALCGAVVDLFSLFGVLAFIGIGVDFGIHLVHRYASEGDLTEALARIAPVNLVAAGIAILGCGTLITSSYPPLQSLGVVSVATLSTCVVGSLLVLPATLLKRK